MTAEAYIEAHRQHNDPDTRVNAFQAELPGLITEFLELVEARDALHARLLKSSSTSQKTSARPSTSLRANPSRGVAKTGTWPVFVRTRALVDILKAAGLEVGGR